MQKGIKEKDIRDFEKYATKLKELLERIQEYCPEANYYLAMSDLNLLCGESHDPYTTQAQQENIVTSVSLGDAGGGDW
jgi:hypothetical protein